jgi:hypothetical protein
VALDGDLQNLEAMLFAKTDGTFRLVLWLETPSFDPVAARVLDVASQQVTLRLPKGFRARRLMTFEASGAPSARSLSGATSRLAIDDNLSVVEIGR